MQLLKISVYGFRSIATVVGLRVGSPTLLAGHNDAGKSALLDSIGFLLGESVFRASDATFEAVGADPLPEGQEAARVAETWVEGEFELRADELDGYAAGQSLRVRRRVVGDSSPAYELLAMVSIESDLREIDTLTVPDLQSLVKKYKLSPGGKTKSYLVDAVKAMALSTSQVETWVACETAIVRLMPKLLRFNPTSDDDAEIAIKTVLASAYKLHLEDPSLSGDIRTLESTLNDRLKQEAKGIVAHIKDRCADIGEVSVIPEVSFTGGLRNTTVEVNRVPGQAVGLGRAGSGKARRVALAVWEYTTDLLAEDVAGDVVVIYDEPDTHLDYHHQRSLMKLIREQCALPNVQMMIATHSMNLIDGVDIGDVVHVRHVNERTELEVLGDDGDIGDHLGAIAASLGLRNTVLLHERLFVGVEGVTEAAAFPILFKTATGQSLEASGIALWACGNNEGAMHFARFLIAHNRNVVFVVDRDSRNRKNIFSDEKLRAYGVDPDSQAYYIGSPNEFEDLFTDGQWAAAANENWPRNDGREWAIGDFTPLRDGKFSTDLLEVLKTASDVGPASKQEMGLRIGLECKEPSDVPEGLTSVFDELLARGG